MNADESLTRVHELIDAALRDALDDPQRAELERLLLEDDAALAAYAQRCELETALRFELRSAAAARRVDAAISGLPLADAPHTTDAASSGKGAAVRRRPFRSRAALAIAASLLLAAGAYVTQRSAAIAAERQPQPVARLESVDAAEWLGDTLAVGHRFLEGDSVYLTGGTARISMASGAEVALRAPCFVSLDTAMLVRVEEGELTAQVADWAHGFTVDTDALRVVDLGTKFAVSTSRRGVSEAHVLDGQVRVLPATPVESRQSLLLSGGEALRFEQRSKLATKLDADRERFDAELSDVAPYKPIPLFNTGKGLQPGDEDPHWRVVAGPDGPSYRGPQFAVVCNADRRYLDNEPEHSQWVSLANPVRPGMPANTEFTFQTSFDLSGYDLDSVVVSAQVIADNGVRAVRLNGQAVPAESWMLNAPDQVFNRFHVIELAGGFIDGENVVEFDVWNGVDRYERRGVNPLALRVEWRAFGRSKAPEAGLTAASSGATQDAAENHPASTPPS